MTLAAVLLALPAAAQDIPFSMEATEACVAEAADLAGRRACVGRAAEACMETPDGQTTAGMGACLDAEWRYWDERLNVAYAAQMDLETATEQELEDLGSAAPSPAAALRDMQRAWMAWRDAACIYEASTWGGGTGAGPASAECRLQITGEQALALEDRLRTRSGP
ncbi:lysozyme inhibitor LprI family protein [Amaricoccus sp.]|uniref:lysozyme inhibitor LprI family protein n=1 Tax=Amaricoccus sp. TaxID=1872485 RepID=UPI00260A7871|nr:lysozyme inhibitor LprI family protein [Amaricoccus sp.]HRO11469.1 DUF1311 domain-containing protein [Amaricoccus sp.]